MRVGVFTVETMGCMDMRPITHLSRIQRRPIDV